MTTHELAIVLSFENFCQQEEAAALSEQAQVIQLMQRRGAGPVARFGGRMQRNASNKPFHDGQQLRARRRWTRRRESRNTTEICCIHHHLLHSQSLHQLDQDHKELSHNFSILLLSEQSNRFTRYIHPSGEFPHIPPPWLLAGEVSSSIVLKRSKESVL